MLRIVVLLQPANRGLDGILTQLQIITCIQKRPKLVSHQFGIGES